MHQSFAIGVYRYIVLSLRTVGSSAMSKSKPKEALVE